MATAANVLTTRDGDLLRIEIDLTRNLGPTKTGKTDKIASTGGFLDLDDPAGTTLNLLLLRRKNGGGR